MIIDSGGHLDPALLETEYDAVVVGAGPIGIYLARCLHLQGKSVIILEAGGRVTDSSRNDIATKSVGVTSSDGYSAWAEPACYGAASCRSLIQSISKAGQ
jgi:cation diffusion facilitator CzcD-associated flavoprotein CzcO